MSLRCTAGKLGKRLVRRAQDLSFFRRHVSVHLAEGFIPSSFWLARHGSRLCPGCLKAVVSLSKRCFTCVISPTLCVDSDAVQSDVESRDSSSDSDPERKFEVGEILQAKCACCFGVITFRAGCLFVSF